jgi:hypothetical protein
MRLAATWPRPNEKRGTDESPRPSVEVVAVALAKQQLDAIDQREQVCPFHFADLCRLSEIDDGLQSFNGLSRQLLIEHFFVLILGQQIQPALRAPVHPQEP